MRKVLSFLLAVLLAFSFAGCSAEREPAIIDNSAVLGSVSEESSSEETESILISEETSSASESDALSSEESSSSSSSEKSESISSSSSSASSESSSSSSSQSSSSSSSQSSSSSSSSESSSESSSKKEEEEEPKPSVSPAEETRAVWISYLEYQSILQGKTKSQFTQNIRKMFSNLADDGFNTVFVHVRSHSDAMYDSDIFPWSVYCTGTEGKDPGYDPLEIMVSEAHGAGLRIEAWINPYRIKGTSDTSKIALSSPAYDWLDTEKVVVINGGGIYYNPADEEVIDLVVSGVEEIVSNYDVDGIHFDDYFYPTTAESFDSVYYSEYKANGGNLGLAAWRRQNVNKLIKEVYSAIKAIDSSCRFGVSPTGNMTSNYNELYCDVYTWVTSKGYIDYICPQLYYGFNNKSKPYLDVLSEFSDMITRNDVELIVGLAAYKSGAVDNYAGTGKNEWTENTDVLERQVTTARNEAKYGGFSLYRYDSLYNPSSGTKSYIAKEMENLIDIM